MGKAERTVRTAIRANRRIKDNGNVCGNSAERPPKRRVVSKMVNYEEIADNEAEEKNFEPATMAGKRIKKNYNRQRKWKEPVLPLEVRTVDTKLCIGAHVSVAGADENNRANAFAMFMKNPRKWDNPDMDPEHASLFIRGCKSHNIEVGNCCIPHGSYLINLAHPDPERKKQAYESFRNDLVRCDMLGIKLYNFHPGNSNATTREEGIKLIAKNINRAHEDPSTGSVVTVLETMATLGNTIGSTFEEIAAIISYVKDKCRVGVCLDTCHVFAAGYDLRSPELYAEVMAKFDAVIGLKYLKALHMNDSKAPLASYRDLHARIGTGYLGLRAFHNLVNDTRIQGLPIVLETPMNSIDENGKKWEDRSHDARQIKLLERLVGMDVESDEFKDLEKSLHEQGNSERERIGDQVERKKVKDGERMEEEDD